MDGSNDFKVRLESYSFGTSSIPTDTIVFDVMPTLTESVQVEYQSIDPLHMPGSFYVYKGTKARTFELGELKLISRTSEEASKNQSYVNILRSWTRPYFGLNAGSMTQPQSTSSVLGGGGSRYYAVQDQASATVDKAKLRPMTNQELISVLNLRNAKTKSNTQYSRVKNYDLQNMTAKDKEFLESSRAQATAATILDNLDEETALGIKLRDSESTNIQPHSIIRVNPGEAAIGQGGSAGSTDLRFLGAPPDVLYLTAYSDSRDMGGKLDKPTNINRVPVVITAFSLTYPNDVDYIPTTDNQPFPIIMTLTLSLVESNSPREMEKFDLQKYRQGLLPGF